MGGYSLFEEQSPDEIDAKAPGIFPLSEMQKKHVLSDTWLILHLTHIIFFYSRKAIIIYSWDITVDQRFCY